MFSTLDITPTPSQNQQLQGYAALLRQWNPKINLVGPDTLAALEERHILDSAQLVPLIQALEHPNTRTTPYGVLDVGSGAGLPGLILAILLPGHTFTLAERDQRKAAFLATAAHTLGLANARIHAADVNALKKQNPLPQFDVITARAWASFADIITQTSPLLAENGCWLLPKGEAVQAEITAYAESKNMTFTRTPSITNPKACILQVRPSKGL